MSLFNAIGNIKDRLKKKQTNKKPNTPEKYAKCLVIFIKWEQKQKGKE